MIYVLHYFRKLGILLLLGLLLILEIKAEVITQNTTYFIDSNNLSKTEIQNVKFLSYDKSSYLLQSKYPVWIQYKIPPSSYYQAITFSTAMIDSLQLIYPFSQVEGDMVVGGNSLQSLLPIFYFAPSNDTTVALFRMFAPSELQVFNIQLNSIKDANRSSFIRASVMAFFTGVLLIVFLLTIVIYLISPSKLGFNFIVFSGFSFLFFFTTSGIPKLIASELQYYLSFLLVPILGLMMISGILLSIRMLRIRYYSVWLYRILWFFIFVIVFCILLCVFGMQSIAINIVNPLGGIIIPIYIYSSWKTYRDNKPYALYYLIGWFLYFVVMFYLVLVIFGAFDPSIYLDYIAASVSIIYFIFIIAAIIGKVRYFRSEREKAEKNHLESVSKMNVLLEQKVKERTYELEKLNNEINKQNIELKAHKEKIIILNEGLEKTVEDRTSELSMALLNLEKRTKELEEFSHVVSHNLRGPVASLLGLIQVYDKKNPASPSNEELIEYMFVSATGLDKVITDLNQILSIKKMSQEERVPVDLPEIFELTKTLLNSQIKETGAHIIFNCCQPVINSIPAFLNNIFYNLIANSIKYSRPSSSPLITIDMECEPDMVTFRFKDNGIGMSVSDAQKDQIFKMYYRVSKTKEGKGVGLYLVKSQVESLGGTIDYVSVLGEGTTFIINLPLR